MKTHKLDDMHPLRKIGNRLMRLIALLLLATCVVGCGKKSPESLMNVGHDETEMAKAIEKARNEVDFFVNELADPAGKDHAVKIALKDGDKIEHVWLTEVTFADGSFTGKINNAPTIVSNASMGESKTVKKTEISDWLFFYDSTMYGNFTVRPFLDSMPKKEAEKMRLLLGE